MVPQFFRRRRLASRRLRLRPAGVRTVRSVRLPHLETFTALALPECWMFVADCDRPSHCVVGGRGHPRGPTLSS